MKKQAVPDLRQPYMVILSTDVLAPKSDEVKGPPKIFHKGCNLMAFTGLRGCVRGSDEEDFWHAKPLDAWIGQEVIFVLQDQQGKPLKDITHVIKECYEKPIAHLIRDDLVGTLVKIAMTQGAFTVREYFAQNFPKATQAMIIRV